MRILLVEDNHDSGESLWRMLNRTHSVEWVKDDEAALLATEGREFDLIISDISLGTHCGLAMMRSIRAGVLNAKTPSIAVSGLTLEHEQEAALAAGFNLHVSKPINFTSLTSLITSLTTRRSDGVTDQQQDQSQTTDLGGQTEAG